MKKTLLLLLCAVASSLAWSQDFTLENQYNKMKKKYPFIQPYSVSDSGLYVHHNVFFHRAAGNIIDLTFDYFSKSEIFTPSNRALIIFVHGGGWASGSKAMDHAMAIAMAQRGFSCVCIDYVKSGIAQYPEAVVDVMMAVRMARQYPQMFGFDGKRICLVGSSAGGQLAALVGTNDDYLSSLMPSDSVLPSAIVNRVIDIDGVLVFIHPDSSEGNDKHGKLSAATRWLGTPLQADTALWNEASALYHVGASSADYTFIIGTQKRFTAGLYEMIDSLHHNGHSANVVSIFADSKSHNFADMVSENETPHCFWLFSPWAELVVGAIVNALSDWSN